VPLLVAVPLIVAALAGSPRAAAGGPAVPPVDCPPGTELVGGAPPEGYEAWCAGAPDDAGNLRRHGPARTWYDRGLVHEEWSWVRGRRDGAYVELHRNGQRARAGRYAQDEQDGPWSTWDERGQLLERIEFRRGVRHGPAVAWWPNGRKRSEGRWCGGAQCGTWSSWDESGHELGRMEIEAPVELR